MQLLPKNPRARTYCLNALLVVVSVVVALELTGYLSHRYLPGMYDSFDNYLTRASKQDMQSEYVRFMHHDFSPLTGWKAPQNLHYSGNNCLQKPQTYSYDNQGARGYAGYDRKNAEVILGGGSYILGDEISDDETVAARIFQHSGIISANLAYRDFDPAQAFLRIRAERRSYPAAKVVVLGIMYEDINSIVNGYRPIYSPGGTSGWFKPYMQEGRLHKLSPVAFQSFPDYLNAQRAATREDYWAKPRWQFPYSVTFVRALASYAFRQGWLSPVMARRAGHEFRSQYRNHELGENLLAILSPFTDWARREKLTPVVVFIPRNLHDTTSPTYWINNYKDLLPPGLTLENINFAPIDGARYNLKPEGLCHPSPYGAEQIAEQYQQIIAHALKENAQDYPATSAVPPATERGAPQAP